jgi:hypothetical protein
MKDYSAHDAWVEEMYPSDQYIVLKHQDKDLGPTDKYGIWLGIAVFGGIVIFSCFMVAVILYVSRVQERAKFASMRGASLKSSATRRHGMSQWWLPCWWLLLLLLLSHPS